MELPDLGVNCQKQDCNALDFLPIICHYCSKTFCTDHFYVGSHSCECVVTIQADITKETKKSNFACSITECNKNDVVQMRCIKCKNHFCLNHRYHNCFPYSDSEIVNARNKLALQKEEFSKTFAKVESETLERIEKCKKSTKTRDIALKVQLMKLKGKAVGDAGIPTTDRVYFMVFMPLRLKLNSKSVFVNSNWSIGKIIDNISTLCNVPNKNNVSGSDKLRLFLKSDGNVLSHEMSKILSEFIDSNIISNGDSLVFEYVPPDALIDFKITQIDHYAN